MKKLYKLRELLAQNPELGVGVLDEYDDIVTEVYKMYTEEDVNNIRDYEQNIQDMLRNSLKQVTEINE
jgi:hypothetical protein